MVAVAETHLSADTQVVMLPASHTFMMNYRHVRALVREVLARSAAQAVGHSLTGPGVPE
jgi:hypothetical protein